MSTLLAPPSSVGPYLRMPPTAPSKELSVLVAGLGHGRQTGLDANGLMHLNTSLIEDIVGYREAAVVELERFLARTENPLSIAEGLYTAQRLAEEHVSTVRQLYHTTARWNYTHDPLIQIYLAGFYRKLNLPETFGPMLATLIHQATHHYPARNSALSPLEEVGGTVLQQLAQHTAQEILRSN